MFRLLIGILLVHCSSMSANSLPELPVSSGQPLSTSPASTEYDDNGIDMTAPLSPVACKWREIPHHLYRSFGQSYEQLGPGFFRFYSHQVEYNGNIVKNEIGVSGDVRALVRKLWDLGVQLWAGLRDVLFGIERLLESFLHLLANYLEMAAEKAIQKNPGIREDLQRIHQAIRSADHGYEENYQHCRALYMRELRRQLNGMQFINSKLNRTEHADMEASSKLYTRFYDRSTQRLVDVMRKYWRESLNVYHTNWKTYSDECLVVLKHI